MNAACRSPVSRVSAPISPARSSIAADGADRPAPKRPELAVDQVGVEPRTGHPRAVAERRIARPEVDARGDLLVWVRLLGAPVRPAPRPDRVDLQLRGDLACREDLQLGVVEPADALETFAAAGADARPGSRGRCRSATAECPSRRSLESAAGTPCASFGCRESRRACGSAGRRSRPPESRTRTRPPAATSRAPRRPRRARWVRARTASRRAPRACGRTSGRWRGTAR